MFLLCRGKLDSKVEHALASKTGLFFVTWWSHNTRTRSTSSHKIGAQTDDPKGDRKDERGRCLNSSWHYHPVVWIWRWDRNVVVRLRSHVLHHLLCTVTNQNRSKHCYSDTESPSTWAKSFSWSHHIVCTFLCVCNKCHYEKRIVINVNIKFNNNMYFEKKTALKVSKFYLSYTIL